MCFFARPTTIATLLRKNGNLPKLVVDFLLEKRKQNHGSRRGLRRKKEQRQTLEIVEDFACGHKNRRNLRRFRKKKNFKKRTISYVSSCFLIFFIFHHFSFVSSFFIFSLFIFRMFPHFFTICVTFHHSSHFDSFYLLFLQSSFFC